MWNVLQGQHVFIWSLALIQLPLLQTDKAVHQETLCILPAWCHVDQSSFPIWNTADTVIGASTKSLTCQLRHLENKGLKKGGILPKIQIS